MSKTIQNSFFLTIKLFHNLCLEVNEEHDSIPKVLNHLIDKPDRIDAGDFLKEDIYSSPKFIQNQSHARKIMQMRFDLSKAALPIKRSLVGSKNSYIEHQQTLKNQQEELTRSMKNN